MTTIQDASADEGWETSSSTSSSDVDNGEHHLAKATPPSKITWPDNEAWYEASTYREVLNLNKAFIRGERKTTVYHYGPLNEETTPLISNILRLHEYGFLTHGGQPYQNDGPCPSDDYVFAETEDACMEWRQRPYLDFLVPCTEVSTTSVLPRCEFERLLSGGNANHRVKLLAYPIPS